MNNPFSKPRTRRQWLLGSACWLCASLGSWLAFTGTLVPPSRKWYEGHELLAVIGFAVVHGLIWKKAVFSWRPAPAIQADGLGRLAGLWLLALVAFQLVCLAHLLVVLAFVFRQVLTGMALGGL